MNRQLQKVHSDEDDYSKRNFMEDNSEGTFENQILYPKPGTIKQTVGRGWFNLFLLWLSNS